MRAASCLDGSETVAAIVGAGSGIGRRTTERFANKCAVVVAIDIDKILLRDLSRDLSQTATQVVALAVDATDSDAVRDCFDEIERAVGRLDILVNSSTNHPGDGLIAMNPHGWDDDISSNLRAPFLTCQQAIRIMERQGNGAIVNVSSINGINFYGGEAYSAAKAGLISLTKAIAVRYGPLGIRANAVAPAAVITPRWVEAESEDPGLLERTALAYPLRRLGNVDDVASAIDFLASEEASWITGAVLPVDGGLLAGDLDRFGSSRPS